MKNLKESWVHELPDCDICNNGTRAYVDAIMHDGRWAFMCERHWKEFGMFSELGTGKGQKLLTYQSRP